MTTIDKRPAAAGRRNRIAWGRIAARVAVVLGVGLLIGAGGWWLRASSQAWDAAHAPVARPAIPPLAPIYTQDEALRALGAFGKTKEAHWPDGSWTVWMTSNPGLPDQCLQVASLGVPGQAATIEQLDWKRTAGAAVTCPWGRTTTTMAGLFGVGTREVPDHDPATYEPLNPRAELMYRLQTAYAALAGGIPQAITKPDRLTQPLPDRVRAQLPATWSTQSVGADITRSVAPAPPVTSWVSWNDKGSIPLGILVIAPAGDVPTACVLWMPDATAC